MWTLIFGLLQGIIKPVFDFLNKRVDAEVQMHLVDSTTLGTITAGGLAAASKADELNASIRTKEGTWGPMTLMMAIILIPFVWHEWQVVLDSSRFIPLWDTYYGIPYPYLAMHAVGTWKIPALPEPWGTVELAIFQSFFIGASAAVAVVAAIKAVKR